MLYRLVILVILIAITIDCRAQKNIPQADSTKYWRVLTGDNNQFIGEIIDVTDGIMTLRTVKFGVIKINQIDIRLIEEVDIKTVVDNRTPPDNVHATHYFLLPSGYGLKPGEAYYHNAMVLVNQFSIGVTKHISMTAGTVPIYLLGADVAPFWVMPKISVPLGNRVNFGGGVLYGKSFYLRDHGYSPTDRNTGVGVAFGMLTVGTRERNVSFGAGQGLGRNIGRQPVIILASMNRIGSHSYLMTESYFFGGGSGQGVGLVSIGGRRVFKRVGFDFGGFLPIEKNRGSLLAIPWAGISVPLGKPHLQD